ncbi:MAG: dihydrofolate reductase [Verrucomicrobia bacterium]|nr:dihydrofolate reductase [Verrucomicrobiota bacterium]
MNAQDRPKVSIYIASSIDGFIARKNGGLDWLDRLHIPDEDFGYREFFDSIDALVMGRKTYETVCGFGKWPYENKRVIVLSDTLKKVGDEAELFTGKLSDLLAKLHHEKIAHIWIDGGVTVSRFLQEGLVDRFIVSIAPIVLGSGIPLFHDMDRENGCRLESVKSYPNGLVQLCYQIVH